MIRTISLITIECMGKPTVKINVKKLSMLTDARILFLRKMEALKLLKRSLNLELCLTRVKQTRVKSLL